MNIMQKIRFILTISVLESAVILSIAAACCFSGLGYILFYNLGYGLFLSITVPILLYNRLQNTNLSIDIKRVGFLYAFGFKPLHIRQIIVLVLFVVFSVGVQIVQEIAQNQNIRFELFFISALPLLMTTFFEEFFFRGFIQTSAEKHFGKYAAVVISGICFTLYHLGYPGFRSIEDILLLWAVGCGFALAFMLSKNNFWVAYLVNLPNAYLTYMLKQEQFPPFKFFNSFTAFVSIIGITAVILFFSRRQNEHTVSKQ